MTPSKPLPMAASLSKNAIKNSSFSKAYGLPGIRLGWLINQDETLMETFLSAKELIFICNTGVDEEIAADFLDRKKEFLSGIQAHVRTNFEILKNEMNSDEYMEWVKPSGGVICFPRINPQIHLDIERFYETLTTSHKAFGAPGHWFEMHNRFMRVSYGYPQNE